MRAHGGLKEGRREIQRLFFLGLGRRNNDYGAAFASFAGFAFGTFGARCTGRTRNGNGNYRGRR